MKVYGRMKRDGLVGRAIPLSGVAMVMALGLVLGGCGLGKAVGLNKNAPDEFSVVSKAPLVIPPDYALRPPRPGERRPQDDSPDVRASRVIFGTGRATDTAETASIGELAMLRYMGASNASGAIRAQIKRENAKDSSEEGEGLLNRILFWRDKPEQQDFEE